MDMALVTDWVVINRKGRKHYYVVSEKEDYLFGGLTDNLFLLETNE